MSLVRRFPRSRQSALPYPATLDLSFLGRDTLDPRITFTRADAATCATYFDSAGVLQTAAANIPRFDYDPATLAARGFLIEESRGNLFQRSDDFGNAYWTKGGATVTTDSTNAPTGTQIADTLVEDTSTGQHRIYRSVSETTNTNAYTVSVFAKADTRTRLYIGMVESPTFSRQGNARFDLSAGTTISASTGSNGATGGSATIQNVGNGWYRCTYTLTLGGTDTNIFCDFNLISSGTTITYTGDGTSGLFLFGAQLETGAFPTSYIPTSSSAPVTRAADAATIPILAPWHNQNEGTFFIQASVSATTTDATARVLYDVTGATFNDRIRHLRAGSSAIVFSEAVVSGAPQLSNVNALFAIANTPFKTALAYKLNDYASCGNGGSIASDTSALVPTVTQLALGSTVSGSNVLCGHIQRFAFYPTRQINTDLQAITA